MKYVLIYQSPEVIDLAVVGELRFPSQSGHVAYAAMAR
jgi:hypothetical protein